MSLTTSGRLCVLVAVRGRYSQSRWGPHLSILLRVRPHNRVRDDAVSVWSAAVTSEREAG